MSTTLKTAQEILASKNKRGIRDIPQTVRAGVRMTKTQLRFCMIVCAVLVIALIVIFQDDIRKFLYNLGAHRRIKAFSRLFTSQRSKEKGQREIKAMVMPMGMRAEAKPMKSGTLEQEQKGETAPKAAANT